jgi:hypothetical protein
MTMRRMPARRSARNVRDVSGRTGSSSTNAPPSAPSTATNTLIDPSNDVRRRTRRAQAGCGAPGTAQSALPMATARPSTAPRIPPPASSTTSPGKESRAPRACASRTIARQHMRGHLVQRGREAEFVRIDFRRDDPRLAGLHRQRPGLVKEEYALGQHLRRRP